MRRKKKHETTPPATPRENELEDVYLLWPKMCGLSNEMMIQTERGHDLYHIRSKVFAPLGKQYSVYNTNGELVASTKQDMTAIFPRHTLSLKNKPVGKLGQDGVIPQNYFIAMDHWPRLTLKITIFDSVYHVRSETELVAEVAQNRSRWIVAVLSNVDRLLLLASLAIIYKENTVGG